MHKWQLHEAKNRLSYLVEVAISGEPQCITKRGEEAVIVMSVDAYKDMTKQKVDFKEFLLNGPVIEDLEVERVVGKIREKDL